MLNEKGQAFTTFKLLIAAVVAIVILAMLLQIINIIPMPGIGDPLQSAKQLLSTAQSSPFTTHISQQFEFKRGVHITSKSLAETSGGLQQSQICINKGDFTEGDNFEFDDSSSITYNGSIPLKARFVAMCSGDWDDADKKSATEQGGMPSEAITSCDCADGKQMCCILVLKRP